MIPHLDDHGLLPPGVHPCSLSDVHNTFATTIHRRILWSLLLDFLKELKAKAMAHPIYLGGGFISAKDTPNDIDLIHDVRAASDFDQFLAWRLFSTARDDIKAHYRIDYLVNLPGNSDFSALLQYVGPKVSAATGLDEKAPRGVLYVGDPYAELE